MGGSNQEPQYSGIDKFPGTIATVITLIVGAIFLGGLYREVLITAEHHADQESADHAEGGDQAKGGDH